MFRPLFRYTHELVQSLLAIESARAVIDALPLSRTSMHNLREESRKAQLRGVERLDGNVAGYAAALNQLATKSADCPDEETLAKLHAALAGKASGGYRESSALVYNQARTDLIYMPPEAPDVPGLMLDLLDWLAGAWHGLPAVLLAGIAQQELLLIQPFEHANGPLARLLGELILVRKGYGFGGYASVETELAADPEAYEKATRSAHTGVYSRKADFTGWLEFYVQALATAAGRARDEVVNLFEAAHRPRLEPAGNVPLVLRDRQRQALDYLRVHGAIRSGEYQRLAKIVPDTARRDFDELMDKGLIAVRGVGRATHYVLTQLGAEEAERRGSTAKSA